MNIEFFCIFKSDRDEINGKLHFSVDRNRHSLHLLYARHWLPKRILIVYSYWEEKKCHFSFNIILSGNISESPADGGWWRWIEPNKEKKVQNILMLNTITMNIYSQAKLNDWANIIRWIWKLLYLVMSRFVCLPLFLFWIANISEVKRLLLLLFRIWYEVEWRRKTKTKNRKKSTTRGISIAQYWSAMWPDFSMNFWWLFSEAVSCVPFTMYNERHGKSLLIRHLHVGLFSCVCCVCVCVWLGSFRLFLFFRWNILYATETFKNCTRVAWNVCALIRMCCVVPLPCTRVFWLLLLARKRKSKHIPFTPTPAARSFVLNVCNLILNIVHGHDNKIVRSLVCMLSYKSGQYIYI